MKNWKLKLLGSGISLLAMLAGTGCTNNDPETPDSVFELVYATYWGGSPQANKGMAIDVDSQGYIYLSGETQCPSFTLKNPIIDKITSTMGFVSKFAPDGQAVVYSTYLGAIDGYNWCSSMAADDKGNAVAVGLVGGPGFPLKNPLYNTFTDPWECGFLSSIAPQGATLNFSTFIPQDRVTAVALDDGQNIYLATMNGTLLKISADGSRLLYEYKIQDDLDDTSIEDIAVASGGALVVSGWTSDPDFPSRNPVQPAIGGLADAFILKLNPQGNDLEFATLLGGTQNDFAYGVEVDGSGAIYVCGSTLSTDFPIKNAVDRRYGGSKDCFAVKIDPVNSTVLYSTFLGGGGEERATAMAVNAAGEAYLSGFTTSTDFPTRGAVQNKLGGVKDPFVTKLSADGARILLSTYCGGSRSDPYVGKDGTGADWGNDICLGVDGKIYITGETYANDFPMLNPLDSYNFFSKAFIAVLSEKPL